MYTLLMYTVYLTPKVAEEKNMYLYIRKVISWWQKEEQLVHDKISMLVIFPETKTCLYFSFQGICQFANNFSYILTYFLLISCCRKCTEQHWIYLLCITIQYYGKIYKNMDKKCKYHVVMLIYERILKKHTKKQGNLEA